MSGPNIVNGSLADVKSNVEYAWMLDANGDLIESFGGSGTSGTAGVASLNGLTGTLSLVGGRDILLATGTTTITISYTGTVGNVTGPTGSYTNSVATWLGTGGNQLQDTLVTIDQVGNTNVSSGNLTLGTAIGSTINLEPTTALNVIMPGDVTASASFQVDNTLFGADHIKLTNPTGVFIPANSGTVAIGTLALPFATGQFVNLNAQTLTVNGVPVSTGTSSGSSITMPATTTPSGIAVYSGTSGGGFINTSVIIDKSNNLTTPGQIEGSGLVIGGSLFVAPNTSISPGTFNTYIGGTIISTGNYNVTLGFDAFNTNKAGFNNVILGVGAFESIDISGSNNTVVGSNTVPFSAIDINETVIGFQTVGSGSNTVAIGNPNITANYFNGTLNAPVIKENGVQVLTTGIGLGNVSASVSNGVITITGTAYTLPSNVVLSGTSTALTTLNLTNLTGTNATFTNEVNSIQYGTTLASGNTTATNYSINWNSGTSQVLSFYGAGTGCTLSLANGIAGSTYVLTTINNTTGTTAVTWGTKLIYNGGTVLNLTPSGSAHDLWAFWFDGLQYYTNVNQNFF